MKRIAVLYLAIALLAVGAGQAFARSTHAAPTKVTVVMHDPGCHWFSVNGTFKTKLAVKGPAKLFNVDEAALKVVGARHDPARRRRQDAAPRQGHLRDHDGRPGTRRQPL